MTMPKAMTYPNAPRAGMPQIFGFISVVQIMLELMSSAMTHRPMTIFWTILLKSLASSGEACRSRFTFVCPFR